MPGKKPRSPRSTTPKPGYWQNFMESLNLVGEIGDEAIQQQTSLEAGSNLTLTSDQYAFLYRVAETLVPTEGYPPHIKKQLLNTRQIYRKGLEQVFKEQKDFNQWFTETRRNCNMRDVELMEILYNCLEGLKDPQILQMREDFGKVLSQTRMARAGIH